MKITRLFFSLSLQSISYVAASAIPFVVPPHQDAGIPAGVIHLPVTTVAKAENETDTGGLAKRITTATPSALVFDRPLYNEYTGSFYLVNCTPFSLLASNVMLTVSSDTGFK